MQEIQLERHKEDRSQALDHKIIFWPLRFWLLNMLRFSFVSLFSFCSQFSVAVVEQCLLNLAKGLSYTGQLAMTAGCSARM